jgi:carboxylate-amine ligase
MSTRIHLFKRYGIELEYMIVDKDTLAIRPITDELFKSVAGDYCSDVARGEITWCNELVLHVLEFKCTQPQADLVQLSKHFQHTIEEANSRLAAFNAKLLPSAAHPLMNPDEETYLWPHDNNEVYALYNKIFNCRGHGWANLQSTHLNLPFYDDEEFAKLHAAVRLILPILPCIAASSPMLNGKDTGYLDKRLDYYQKNQRAIPAIIGNVIPERAFSKRQYHKLIYDRISKQLVPYDEKQLLNPVWVNSRGAIARFDRGSIEIRLLDIQECPNADLAIVSLIIGLIKLMVEEKISNYHEQHLWESPALYDIFQQTIRLAENAIIDNKAYLELFGINKSSVTATELWRHLLALVEQHEAELIAPWTPILNNILDSGTLATRILKAIGGFYTESNIKMVYQELSDCLQKNEVFVS